MTARDDASIDSRSDQRFHEARRLATLHALALLDSDPEAEFDALVALAAELLDCPTSFISLVDRDRQWLKARINTDLVETRRDIAFCDHTIREDKMLVVENTALDPRFAANPLSAGEKGIRFYASSPIHALDDEGTRQPIGTLCVVDHVPRHLGDAGRRALVHLTTLAEALIAARGAARRAHEVATLSHDQAVDLARKDRIFREAERMAQIGSWSLDLVDQRVVWSEGVYRIHGLPMGEMPELGAALEFYPPDARARVSAAMARTMETGDPFDIEEDFIDAQGRMRRVRARAEREMVDGRPTALLGVFQDITEHHALETQLRRSANTDALTDIANRAAFERFLPAAMTRAQAERTELVLALIDLDGFKAINDTLGHNAGDDVLRAVGRVLREPWLKGSFAARLGGDEFALVVDDPVLTRSPASLCERLQQALQLPVAANGVSLNCAGSVGFARLGADCRSLRDLVHRADTVLYAAKRARVGERRRAGGLRVAG